jgi:hypothetical protein
MLVKLGLPESKSGFLEHTRQLERELDAATERLREIGDYAHEHSTGPAVPDALWTVREMAYELV